MIEIVGPFPDHDEFERAVDPIHPYHYQEDEVLFYYDQPLITICHVDGDDRPRLDIVADEKSSGGEGERVYTTTRHHLVFDSIETLRATLHDGCGPTTESYEMAETIIRYQTISTQIGHPRQRHTMITAQIDVRDVPSDEMPYTHHRPQGLPTPSNRHQEKSA